MGHHARRVLVTGMNGTVAPAAARVLAERGWEVVPWDRSASPTEREAEVKGFIKSVRPDAVLHIATGAPVWARWIAEECADSRIPLIWTGSVSVFGGRHMPPYTPEMQPDATDDYGKYKIECENLVRTANPSSIIARLGWQIGTAPGSNNMMDYLHRQAAEAGGTLNVSGGWVPSCAFLEDTASAMVSLLERCETGTFHLEGNGEGLSMARIASGLKALHGLAWSVVEVSEPVRDNRMTDPRIRLRSVGSRLSDASS